MENVNAVHISRLAFIVALLGIGLILSGCGDGSLFSVDRDLPPPEISDVEPDSGRFDTEVTITGKNFGSLHDAVSVHFNGKEAAIVNLKNNKLVVHVPKRAGTGPIEVSVYNKKARGPVFTFIMTLTVESWAGSDKGFRDDYGEQARFYYPWGVAVDTRGNLFIGDSDNALIRKVTWNRDVQTYAGNPWRSGYLDGHKDEALLTKPMGVELGPNGVLYIADAFNFSIRMITLGSKVQTYAGIGIPGNTDGKKEKSSFNAPSDLAITSDHTFYITDTYNYKIRKIDPDGNTTTLAGSGTPGYRDGPAELAQFVRPVSLAIDPDEKTLYVADIYDHRVRRIDTETGRVSTLIGDGEPGFKDGNLEEARINRPAGIEVGSDGTIYFTDSGNHVIRMIRNNKVTTVAGNGSPGTQDGPALQAQFNRPYHLAFSGSETFLYITDWENHRIRRIRFD